MMERTPPAPPLAFGWATVELDRAAEALGPMLVPGTSFTPATPSEHLGAACRVGRVDDRFVDELAPTVVLLEPTTEGRLAATLARFGEGWCATWEGVARGSTTAPTPERRSAARPGPLGTERLVLGGAIHGPHRLLVAPATIEP